MTGSQRQQLRQLIDQRVRGQVALEEAEYGVKRCAGCGCELDTYIADCRTCQDRRLGRLRRKLERERRLLFQGRCQLCGEHATGAYCHAHEWAAA